VNALPQDTKTTFENELRLAQVAVLGYLVRLTGHLADARDLLQDTNLTAWEKRDSFTTGTSLVAWMRAIALNHYRNATRRELARPTVALLDDDLVAMVETRHLEREREEARKRRFLQLCLAKLPERQRAVVEMYYYEGASLEEIGASQSRKANAMAQLLHRARTSLIECVRRESHRELDHETFPTL